MNAHHGIPENRFNPHCWITGKPEIGDGTWIGAFTLIDGLGGLQIGRHCDISSGAQILSHSTARRCIAELAKSEIDYAKTEIGDHVFIGTNAVVLMGAIIGHHSIIAAGAVVLQGMVVPPYSLVAGVPGMIKRNLESEIQAWQEEAIYHGLHRLPRSEAFNRWDSPELAQRSF